jgi:hypothetical protein
MAIKHRKGIYDTFFKSTPPPRDTLSQGSTQAKPDNQVKKDTQAETQPVNNDPAASIPPEVDSLADSILRGVKHKSKSDPQFYRDSIKNADTSKLSF